MSAGGGAADLIVEEKKKEKSTGVRALKQVVAGGCAGALTKTSVAPLERIKIIFQVRGMKQDPTFAAKYTGIVPTLMTIVREEGFLSLYRGNGANCLRIIPVYALKFGLNDVFKEMVRRPGQDVNRGLQLHQLVASGFMAGIIQNTVTYPLDLIKTRLSLAKGMGVRYNGIIDCIKRTVATEGPRGLYKGYLLANCVVGPYVAIQMTCYDVFTRQLRDQGFASNSSVFGFVSGKALAGGAAGAITQLVTFPGNTMIKRMQSNGLGGTPKVYANSFDCIKKILEREGIAGFYKGMGVNIIKGIPNAAVQFVAYDTMKWLLKL